MTLLGGKMKRTYQKLAGLSLILFLGMTPLYAQVSVPAGLDLSDSFVKAAHDGVLDIVSKLAAEPDGTLIIIGNISCMPEGSTVHDKVQNERNKKISDFLFDLFGAMLIPSNNDKAAKKAVMSESGVEKFRAAIGINRFEPINEDKARELTRRSGADFAIIGAVSPKTGVFSLQWVSLLPNGKIPGTYRKKFAPESDVLFKLCEGYDRPDLPNTLEDYLADSAILCAAYSAADGKQTVIGTENGAVLVLNSVTGKLLRLITPNGEKANAVSFADNDQKIIAGRSDGRVCIYDAYSGELLITIHAGTSVHAVAVMQNQLVTASQNGIAIWNLLTGEQLPLKFAEKKW
jgi:WD40 repeat protein